MAVPGELRSTEEVSMIEFYAKQLQDMSSHRIIQASGTINGAILTALSLNAQGNPEVKALTQKLFALSGKVLKNKEIFNNPSSAEYDPSDAEKIEHQAWSTDRVNAFAAEKVRNKALENIEKDAQEALRLVEEIKTIVH